MSGRIQRRRNYEKDLDEIEMELGSVDETMKIILHDFTWKSDPNLDAKENHEKWLESKQAIIIEVPISPEKAKKTKEWNEQRKRKRQRVKRWEDRRRE